jgi:hypothetical protein
MIPRALSRYSRAGEEILLSAEALPEHHRIEQKVKMQTKAPLPTYVVNLFAMFISQFNHR